MNRQRKVSIGNLVIFICLAFIVIIFFLYGHILQKSNEIIHKTTSLDTKRTYVSLLLQEVLFSERNLYLTYDTFSSAYTELAHDLTALTGSTYIKTMIVESENIRQSITTIENLMKVNEKRMDEIEPLISNLRENHPDDLPGLYSVKSDLHKAENPVLFQLAIKLKNLPIYYGGAWDISFKNMVKDINNATEKQTFTIEVISISLIGILVVSILILARLFNRIFTEVEDLSINLEQKVIERSKELNRVLYELSITDELTGLFNRRHFNMIFEREWKGSIRENKPISIIMLDIDYFKLFNDNYGHLAGDSVIASVSSAIQSALNRPSDTAARYGGEEFIVLLTNTDLLGSYTVAKRIRSEITRLSLEHIKSPISSIVTVSIGLATSYPRINDKSVELIRRADENLYRAKEDGRDRICLPYLPEQEQPDPCQH